MVLSGMTDIIIITNVILALLIVIEDIYFYYKIKEDTRWSKLLYAGVGFAWSIYFLDYSLFNREPVSLPVLILITFTLLSLTVGANIRVKREIGTNVF